MKTNKLFVIFILSLFVFASCNDKNFIEPFIKGNPVLSVSSTTDIDLTGRQDWQMKVGFMTHTVRYNYTFENNTFVATPTENSQIYYYAYGLEDGDLLRPDMTDRVDIYLHDIRYYTFRNTRTSPTINYPDILDQSTPEKFLIADCLHAVYGVGTVTSHVEGLKLTHANSLIEITMEDDIKPLIFVSALTYAYQQLVTPLKENGVYKYIAHGGISPYISVEYNNIPHSVKVTEEELKPNTRYKVKAKYDNEKSEIVILEIIEEEWK